MLGANKVCRPQENRPISLCGQRASPTFAAAAHSLRVYDQDQPDPPINALYVGERQAARRAERYEPRLFAAITAPGTAP